MFTDKQKEKAKKLLRLIASVGVQSPDSKPIQNPDWQGIVIHHTGIGSRPLGSADEGYIRTLSANMISWLTKKDDTYAAAHWYIDTFGKLVQLVDPYSRIAYHAGKSSWFHPRLRRQVDSCNSFMLGIELLGDGNLGTYTNAQYETLADLVMLNKIIWDFDPRCITGHENVAPGRKSDPGKYFDWEKLINLVYSKQKEFLKEEK